MHRFSGVGGQDVQRALEADFFKQIAARLYIGVKCFHADQGASRIRHPAGGMRVGFPLYERRRYALHCKTAIGRNAYLPLKLRSEEHTSELQSLIRNSYAVF